MWARALLVAVLAGRGALGAVPLEAGLVAVQAPGGGLTPRDVFDLEYVSDAQISPDGSRIVYVREYSDVMTDRTYSNLWILNFDGTGHRPLTTGKHHDASPRWSPDGRRLLFLSDRGGSVQIHVRWMDTGETVEVTGLPYPPQNPVWSPDGEWIAFTSLVKGAPSQLAVLPAPPEGATWAEPARVIDRLVYRFNGVGWLEPGYMHLFVVPALGGAVRQLSRGDYHHGSMALVAAGEPAWSPEGQSILIAANRRPDWELEPWDTEIYEFAVADGAMRRLTDRRGPDNAPAVSPDGRRIAYTGFDDRYQGYQVTRLYVADRDGANPRVLAGELDRDIRLHRWASDGSGLYFLYDDRGNTKLGFVSLTGQVRKLADHVGSGGINYGGGSYSVARNGRFAYTYTRPHVPPAVAVGGAPRDTVRVVTNLNANLLAQRTLGEVEEIWYASSRDSRPIHGWIIKPPGFDPSKKYPLILEIHGGPFANYGDRFDVEKQVMAGAGYVVLYTNPRGSTSYGEEFGNLIHHAYPGDDFYDLESGVDAVIAKGYVDPERLYITGGSGGGVLTTWVIGRTNRYRAAVVFYPVTNWYSFALTSDVPIIVNKYWFPKPLWHDPDSYVKRSPISLVGNVTTPTLLMTGAEDYRTPMSETEQYYQALKLRGVETVMVQVPGEAHGIWGRPSHFMTKLQYLIAWFDRFDRAARTGGG